MKEDTKRLICHLTGFELGDENFDLCMKFTKSNFKYHKFLSPDSHKITRDVEGLCHKFKVHSQQHKASALADLSAQFLDSPGLHEKIIGGRTEVHYAMLSLLLLLSESPIHSEFLPRAPKELIAEPKDTFDWAGYLLESEDCVPVTYSSSESDWDDDLVESDNNLEDSEGSEEAILKLQRLGDNLAEESSLENDDPINPSGSKSKNQSHISNETVAHDPLNPGNETAELERRVMTQYWEGMGREEEAGGGHGGNNLARDWHYFKKQENEFATATATSVVTEAQVMREVLWMLAGVTKLFIFKHDGNEFSVNSEVYMMHLTTESMESSLRPFLRKANQVQALCTFVPVSGQLSDNSNSPGPPQTLQAFACCVSYFLSDLRAVLTSLEVKVMDTDSLMTIDKLSSELRPWFKKLQAVHGVYISGVARPSVIQTQNNCMSACALLDALYDAVFEHDLLAEPQDRGPTQLLFQMLIASSEPLLRIASDWLNFGQLVDPKGEFVLQRNKNIKSLDETFWEKAFVSNMTPDNSISTESNHKTGTPDSARFPKFLCSILGSVILTGKSMEMLDNLARMGEALSTGGTVFELPVSLYSHLLQELSAQLPSSIQEHIIDCEDRISKPIGNNVEYEHNIKAIQMLEPNLVNKQLLQKGEKDTLLLLNLEALFSKEKPADDKNAQTLESLSPSSLHAVLRVCESSLRPYVATRYTQVCSCLLNILQTEYKLMECLHAMQKYFLMSAGEVMYDFYTRVFLRIHKGETWREQGLLDMFMQESVEPVYPDDTDRLTVVLEGDVGNGIATTDCIKLRYNVPWPVAVVIASSMLGQYNQIFNFLMQIKRAKFTLEQLRFEELSKEKIQDPKVSTGFSASDFHMVDSMPVAQRIRRFQLLKFRLLYFVNSLHNYIMTRILHSSGLEFSEQLHSASDLEEVIQLHGKYLSLIHERCLLHPKLAFVKKAVSHILSLSLTLSHQWGIGGAELSGAAVQELEHELKRLVEFLASFLNNITKRGSFPHLESLASALAASM